MLYSFLLCSTLFSLTNKNVGCSSASRLRYPNIYYRTHVISLKRQPPRPFDRGGFLFFEQELIPPVIARLRKEPWQSVFSAFPVSSTHTANAPGACRGRLPSISGFIDCAQSTRSLPQKNRATVPGPVWEPMVVPT